MITINIRQTLKVLIFTLVVAGVGLALFIGVSPYQRAADFYRTHCPAPIVEKVVIIPTVSPTMTPAEASRASLLKKYGTPTGYPTPTSKPKAK